MKALRNVLNALNLHFFALGLLVALNLFFCLRLIGAWHTLHAASPDQVQQTQSAHRALDLETRPLRGLPQKIDQAREQANLFYDQRLPSEYSTISSAFYDLAGKNSIRVSHLSYVPAPAIPGLAEIRMDSSLSGQYEPLMHFINGLERSKTFFLINDLTFTGQQGGLVNLRLRLTTYMRASDLRRTGPQTVDQAGPNTAVAPAPVRSGDNVAQIAGQGGGR